MLLSTDAASLSRHVDALYSRFVWKEHPNVRVSVRNWIDSEQDPRMRTDLYALYFRIIVAMVVSRGAAEYLAGSPHESWIRTQYLRFVCGETQPPPVSEKPACAAHGDGGKRKRRHRRFHVKQRVGTNASGGRTSTGKKLLLGGASARDVSVLDDMMDTRDTIRNNAASEVAGDRSSSDTDKESEGEAASIMEERRREREAEQQSIPVPVYPTLPHFVDAVRLRIATW